MSSIKKNKLQSHEDVLREIADRINISESMDELARGRYKSIGEWLDGTASKRSTASEIKKYKPEVYPQGSFLLGTVIRPVSEEDEYDIDLVCTLDATTQDFSMAELKRVVGEELIDYSDAHGMKNDPEDARRCWTLEYAAGDNFHIDILPSLSNAGQKKQGGNSALVDALIKQSGNSPLADALIKQSSNSALADALIKQSGNSALADALIKQSGNSALADALIKQSGNSALADDPEILKHAIAITDNKCRKYNEYSVTWPISNPKGYGLWFQSQQSRWFQFHESGVVLERKQAIVEDRKSRSENQLTVYDKVEDVPDYKVKTPLQQAIQLLKRHRDVMFEGADDKPISMIITTLAAHAYNGEPDICGALRSILRGMDSFIKIRDGVQWIENPVNPKENFADKWPEKPKKKENFFLWLAKAQNDFGLYLSASSPHKVPAALRDALSKNALADILPETSLVAPAVIPKPEIVVAEADKIKIEHRATKPHAE